MRGVPNAGYQTSIGRIERFTDGVRDRAGANNCRLRHHKADNTVCWIDPKLRAIDAAHP